MKLSYAILAEKVIVEADTKNLSLIGLVEEIAYVQVDPTPIQHGQSFSSSMTLVALFIAESDEDRKNEIPCQMRIVTPAGAGKNTYPFVVNFTGLSKARIIIRSHGFIFHGDGTYTFEWAQKDSDKWMEMAAFVLKRSAQVPFPIIAPSVAADGQQEPTLFLPTTTLPSQ